MSIAKKMLLVDENYIQMLKKFGGSEHADREQTAAQVEENSDRDIVLTLPKTFRAKGEALLVFLKQNGITRDKGQRVLVQGKVIPETNFLDILHDLLRYRDLPPPKGFQMLAPILKSLNISRELVTNMQRYKEIMDTTAKPSMDRVMSSNSSGSHETNDTNSSNIVTVKENIGKRKRGRPAIKTKMGAETKVKKWITW